MKLKLGWAATAVPAAASFSFPHRGGWLAPLRPQAVRGVGRLAQAG
nr:MAG TPA: hypothetical protein [Caudoviricetes sp.]